MGLVIFDLDGTLVDSARGILRGLREGLEAIGCVPHVPLSRAIVGPPLQSIIAQLVGEDAERQHILKTHFMAAYDSVGCLEVDPFPGVCDMLEELHQSQVRLAIATNKRILPTQKILSHLGWVRYFDAVYSLDSITPAAPDKAELLSFLMREQKCDIAETVYIGDRLEDADAASKNRLKFLLADWGYGDAQKAHFGDLQIMRTPCTATIVSKIG
jgi:phosphoglycolate phosphatase